MKFTTWEKFLELVKEATTHILVDGEQVTIWIKGEKVCIYWNKEGEEYTFSFSKSDNKHIPIRKNELSLFCNDKEADVFTFEIFELRPINLEE